MKKTILEEEITLEKRDKQLLDFYYCPKCKRIPKIELRDDANIEISCQCFEHFGVIEDDGKMDPMTLSSYEKYIVTFKRYFNLIQSLKENNLPKCQLNANHKSRNAKAYCSTCCIFLCNNCENNHKVANEKHKVVRSTGFIISSICEEETCEKKKEITSFCISCNKHLCLSCKYNHLEKQHNVEDVWIKAEEGPENRLNTDLSKRMSFISEGEKSDSDTEVSTPKAFEQMSTADDFSDIFDFERANNIINLRRTLINPYILCIHDNNISIPNYIIRHNILFNDVENIRERMLEMSKREKAGCKKLCVIY